MGDVRLCLAFEKAFVPALAETRGGVHDELGVGCERDAPVARQVVAVRWRPLCVRIIRPDLQVNQVVLASVVPSHRGECFPIHALLINAHAAPRWFVLKNLVSELIDAGTRLARAGVARDKPAATKLIPLPSQTAEPRDTAFTISRHEQEPSCDECQKNPGSYQEVLRMPQREHEVWRWRYWAEWNEVEFHHHALPTR